MIEYFLAPFAWLGAFLVGLIGWLTGLEPSYAYEALTILVVIAASVGFAWCGSLREVKK